MVSGSLALLYFLLSFHGGRQGSGPDRGRSPVEWGDFPSVRSSVCSSVRPSVNQASGFRHGWLGLRPGWMAQRGERTDGWTDGRTDVRRENLPILQDFVPYRGRCPKRKKTSHPKASNSQWFPCPASLHWPRSSFRKQGSGPDS